MDATDPTTVRSSVDGRQERLVGHGVQRDDARSQQLTLLDGALQVMSLAALGAGVVVLTTSGDVGLAVADRPFAGFAAGVMQTDLILLMAIPKTAYTVYTVYTVYTDETS